MMNNKEIEEYALIEACGQIFSDNEDLTLAEQFEDLRKSVEGELSARRCTPWEPFESFTPGRLLETVNGLKDAFVRAMKAARDRKSNEPVNKEVEAGQVWHILRKGATSCITVTIDEVTEKTIVFTPDVETYQHAERMRREDVTLVELVEKATHVRELTESINVVNALQFIFGISDISISSDVGVEFQVDPAVEPLFKSVPFFKERISNRKTTVKLEELPQLTEALRMVVDGNPSLYDRHFTI